MGNVQRLFATLIQWQMQRVPARAEGYSLYLDSTIFERYGRQEGSVKVQNPVVDSNCRARPPARYIANGDTPFAAESLSDVVRSLTPQEQDAVRQFIDYLKQRGASPRQSPFLQAADEFIFNIRNCCSASRSDPYVPQLKRRLPFTRN